MTELTDDKNILSVNKRVYPDQQHRNIEITTVLVAGRVGDYAVYVGIGEPGWVAKYGNKISFAEACIHFPCGLEEEKYRK